MAMKNKQAKIYRTMQGKQIDLDLLIKRNELTPAVGNAKVNARGDELGPGGKIVKKREDVIKDYYNTNAVPDEPTRKEVMPPANAISAEEQAELDSFDDEWIEDADGNFVKKS